MIYDESTIEKIIKNYALPKLHSDLQPYLHGDELHHPLIRLDGGVYPRLYQRINKLYTYKKEQAAKPLIPNEWQAYFPQLTAYERVTKFTIEEFGNTDFASKTPQYFQIVGQIWTDPEVLGQSSSFLGMMLGLFDRQPLNKHVHHIMTSAEQKTLSKLPDELIVFRGHHERLLNGVSWTINCDIALQYAIGSPDDSIVSMGTVKKSEIIAFIERWDEDEIIVPSRTVKHIKLISRF